MFTFYTVNNKGYEVSFGKTFSQNKVVDICVKLVFTGGVYYYAEISKELSDYLKKNKSAWSAFGLKILEKANTVYNDHTKDLIETIWL